MECCILNQYNLQRYVPDVPIESEIQSVNILLKL